MKIITIPECMNPYVVIVNNHTYSYPAGATMEVPRAVAEVIEAHIDAMHSETPAPIGDSAKEVIGILAPAFTKTGSVVTCNPVEGYPLEVVSYIEGGRSQNLITDYSTVVDDYVDPTIALELPAGKYFLWYKGESNLRVAANEIDNVLARVEATETAKETPINHTGGMLLITDTDWMTSFNENNLILTAITESTTSVSLTHNGKTARVDLPVAVSKGSFNWSTGELTAVTSQPNLVADYKDHSKWDWDDPEMQNYRVYDIDLPSGDYTVYTNRDISVLSNASGDWERILFITICDEHSVHTFHHDGGTLRIQDEMGSFAEEYFVLKLVEVTEYVEVFSTTNQLERYEIVGLPGENTLSSSTGDTEVSGRADLNFVIQDLYSKVNALMEV